MATGLLVYAHGASRLCFLCLRALSFTPAGSRLLYLGPLPNFVDLMIGYIDCLVHDMLSCSILNIARHLEPQNRDYSIHTINLGLWSFARVTFIDRTRLVQEFGNFATGSISSVGSFNLCWWGLLAKGLSVIVVALRGCHCLDFNHVAMSPT